MIIAWPGNNKLIHKLCLDGHSDKKKFQEKERIVRNDDFASKEQLSEFFLF